MSILIIIFGSLILLAGILLLVNPDIIFGYLKDNIENSVIHVVAVLVRLIIGALLITQSGFSGFPAVVEVLGWVFVVAGIFLAVIGSNNFRKLMSWVLTNLQRFARLAGLAAVVFGGFLVYAFL